MEICKWAQEQVKASGKTSTMRSFKDPSLSNGVFFLDLLNAIKPGYVDYSLVNQGNSDEDKRLNGESAASAAAGRGVSRACLAVVPGLDILHLLTNSQTSHLDREKDERLDLPGSRRYVVIVNKADG